jgi:hypothetical protein
MTLSLERIGKLLQEFTDKVSRCRDKDNSNMADIQDAYSRLIRLRERYRYEGESLDPAEKAALSKVFEDDTFIEGMGKVRLIADHVETGDAVLRHTDNSPFTITSASSAAAVFANRCVYLSDTDGVPHRWDHLEHLTEAERRITRAFEKAKGA